MKIGFLRTLSILQFPGFEHRELFLLAFFAFQMQSDLPTR